MEKIISKIKAADKNELTLFSIAVAITIIMATISPSFLQGTNIRSMAFQFPEYGIMCYGMMICMISGGIDLSLVGIANLSGIVAAEIMLKMGSSNDSIFIAFIAAMITGAICGLFNGYLVGQLRIPAMLVTLSGGQLYTGLCVAITKGPALTGLSPAFQKIGNGLLFDFVPISLVIFIAVALIMDFILRYTIYGKQLGFMGTNHTASRYAGINNLNVTLKTYMLSGILAAVSGIVMISHYGSAKSDYGTSYTLLTLLIVVLGGVNTLGGKGKILGVSLSIIVLQLISSAFNILRFNSFVKTLVWGLLLIVIMVLRAILQSHNLKFWRRKSENKVS